MGLVSPLGVETGELGRADRRTVGPRSHPRFDASRFACRIAGEVKGFDPSLYIEKKEIKKMDIFIHYAMAAAHIAMEDSGVPVTDQNRERFAVVVGSGIGGLPIIEETQRKFVEGGGNPRVISPFFITGLIVNEAGGNISIKYGLKGPNLATVTACTTGAHAVGEAYRMIQYGDADHAIVPAAPESVITPLAVGGFGVMKALSTRQRRPAGASRPWDRDRDGFVIAEAPGWSCSRRWTPRRSAARGSCGARGYGMSGDACHIAAPSEDGDGPARVMKNCLSDADEPGGHRLHQCARHLHAARRQGRDDRDQAFFGSTRRRSRSPRRSP